jgi:hypothetical protein
VLSLECGCDTKDHDLSSLNLVFKRSGVKRTGLSLDPMKYPGAEGGKWFSAKDLSLPASDDTRAINILNIGFWKAS